MPQLNSLYPTASSSVASVASAKRRSFWLRISAVSLMIFAGSVLSAAVHETSSERVPSTPVRITCHRVGDSDLSARLNACIAVLPACGGVIDTKEFSGHQVLTSDVTISKPTRIVVGCATWMQSAEIRVAASDVAIISGCEERSVIRRAASYAGRLIAYVSPGHSRLEVSGLTFDNNNFMAASEDASAIIYLHSGNNDTNIHHNRFVNLGVGRAVSSGGYSIAQKHVRIEDNELTSVLRMQDILPKGLVRKSGTVTLTTTDSHGLTPGAQIYVSGTTDSSFHGVFTVESLLARNSLTYSQELPDAVAGKGTISVTNLRSISLVTPGFDVHVNRNRITGAGSITLEPSSETADRDIEICGNLMQGVDATNILVRTHDNTSVEHVTICNNVMRDAGLRIGKGCIAIGENTGKDPSTAVFRHTVITGNECRRWGNWPNSSIGISVAGAIAGSTTQDITVTFNTLEARGTEGATTHSGYGIFIRNTTDHFKVLGNRISYTGRSCLAASHARNGEITGNTCSYAVHWPEAKNPAPPREGCYQIDVDSSDIILTGNRCANPGTASGPTNGFYVADSPTVHSITMKENSVIASDPAMPFLLRSYAVGKRACNVRTISNTP